MWKDIPGYEGLYQIDENGNIKGLKSGKIKVIRQPDEHYLYPYILLYKDAQKKKFGIHQLVAKTFIPNPDNLPVVMHKDNNKLNYSIDNLKWGTVEENIRDAFNDGLVPPKELSEYQLYNDSGVQAECKGYNDVIKKVGYGTKSMFNYAIREKSKFSHGPYEGCKVRKLYKGIIYDD